MGLDTTHGCWHGSYTAFSRWRDKLAELAGYTFHKVPIHYYPDAKFAHGRDMPDVDWGNIEATIGRDLNGTWPRIPVRPDGTPDALIVLIAHSDCEGYIQTDMCGPLADRLEELLPELAKLEDDGGHIGNWVEKTETFIKGLRLAAKRGEKVTFH